MVKLTNNEIDNELDAEGAFDNTSQKKKNIQGSVKVLGLSVEKFLTSYEIIDGHSETSENTKYNLFVVDLENKNKYVIHLSTSRGACLSQVCIADYGYMKVEKLEKEMPLSHIPVYPLIIDGLSIDPETLKVKNTSTSFRDEDDDNSPYHDAEINNNVFAYSPHGGDEYYPRGYGFVKMENFRQLARAMYNRPVWILEGDSGTGKSTLASHLEGLTVFETDLVNELPDEITADVVVLGNRSGFTHEDVAKRLFRYPDVNVLTVNFKQLPNNLSNEQMQENGISEHHKSMAKSFSDYAKAKRKKKIEENKNKLKKSRKIQKEIEKSEDRLSGTVIADKIAEDIRSGKEKRVITPEVGAEIRKRKAMEK